MSRYDASILEVSSHNLHITKDIRYQTETKHNDTSIALQCQKFNAFSKRFFCLKNT